MNGLILAGGIGSRFWPLSRRRRPKQLLDLLGGGSLVAVTVRRIGPLCGTERTWVCTTEELAPAVAAELPDLAASHVLSEPSLRNTAPAIGWAVRSMPDDRRNDVIAVMPSDHWIGDEAAFLAALRKGAAAVESGAYDVVTVGVAPAWPETGYGYLELEGPAEALQVGPVARFTEKPDPETAERFVASGRHFWNAGIFLFRGNRLLGLYREHLPDLAAGIERMAAQRDAAGRRSIYDSFRSVSIDYGLMEQLDTIGCVVADCGWSDIGSWGLLAEALSPDESGNRTVGDTVAVDARDNLLFADSGTVVAVGVEGLAVIRTGDAVLVVPRSRAQDVRLAVERLKALDRRDLL